MNLRSVRKNRAIVVLIVGMALACAIPKAIGQQAPDAKTLLSPLVFDWRVYAAIHPQLAASGMSETALQQHWLNTGSAQCWRASSAFDVSQYLELYPDLKAKLGGDCKAAILDYINVGRKAGRRGAKVNSTFGGVRKLPKGAFDAIYGNEVMTIGASSRTAGAIDSLVSGGEQFIDSKDHGRELQYAWSSYGMGECNNPTEGGSEGDRIKPNSTTKVLAITAGPGEGQDVAVDGLFTTVLPAYWEPPGLHKAYCNSTMGQINTTLVDEDQPTSKKVVLGAFRNDPSILGYEFTIDNRKATIPHVSVEAPTGYLTHNFNHFYAFIAAQDNIREIDMKQWHEIRGAVHGSTPYPVILATADKKHAMGVITPDQHAQIPSYALYHFTFSADSPNKWSAVFRWPASGDKNNPGASLMPKEEVHFLTYIVVGSLDEVRQRMSDLTASLKTSAAAFIFDEDVYRKLNPDIGSMNWRDLANDWLHRGVYSGLRASVVYDPAYFKDNALAEKHDQNSWIALQQYFVSTAIDLGLRASLEFDPEYYVAHNPDLRLLLGATGPGAAPIYREAARHWVLHGLREGRDGSADFSPKAYLTRYPDVLAECGPEGYYCATLNWIATGKQSGRNGQR